MLHQLTSSFWDFVRTDIQTDRRRQKTTPVPSIAGAQVMNNLGMCRFIFDCPWKHFVFSRCVVAKLLTHTVSVLITSSVDCWAHNHMLEPNNIILDRTVHRTRTAQRPIFDKSDKSHGWFGAAEFAICRRYRPCWLLIQRPNRWSLCAPHLFAHSQAYRIVQFYSLHFLCLITSFTHVCQFVM